jgi:hypothetical protein
MSSAEVLAQPSVSHSASVEAQAESLAAIFNQEPAQANKKAKRPQSSWKKEARQANVRLRRLFVAACCPLLSSLVSPLR